MLQIVTFGKRMDVVMKQSSEFEETFDSVTREFGNVMIVLAEKLGDKTTVRILRDAKERLEKKTLKKPNKVLK